MYNLFSSKGDKLKGYAPPDAVLLFNYETEEAISWVYGTQGLKLAWTAWSTNDIHWAWESMGEWIYWIIQWEDEGWSVEPRGVRQDTWSESAWGAMERRI